MTENAMETEQDIDLIHRFLAPFLVWEIMCPYGIRGAMQPVALAIRLKGNV